MKRKLFYLLVAVSVLGGLLPGVSPLSVLADPPLPPEVTWSQAFGGASDEYGYSVQPTADGGYIIAGQTASFGAGDFDIYLVKTDASGNMTWSQTFGGTNTDLGRSVQPTPDGGYIIAGYTWSFGAGGADVYLIKVDSDGNMLWSKTFGGTNSDIANSVQPTADGGYIITGYTTSFGAGEQDVYLIKTDTSGNMTWSQTFGGTGSEEGYYVSQTADGGYIISGWTNSSGAGLQDVFFIKTNSSGNLTWSETFGGAGEDRGYSVQQTASGDYIIAGLTSSSGAGAYDVYLINTDVSGNMTWSRTFGGTSSDLGYSVQPTADGGYVIAGYTASFGVAIDVYIIKTDASGNMVWSKTLGGPNLDIGNSVRQTSDGGYVVGGYTSSFGAGATDVYIVKLGPPPDSIQPTVSITSPNQDAVMLVSPVIVTANASDSAGVTALMINGIPAMLVNGTPESGIWQASVNVSLPVSPGGALIFTAVAADAAGNAGIASVTLDNDGISAIIDTDPGFFSDNFSDVPLGGNTSGRIVTRADWTVYVTEAASPLGVRASIGPGINGNGSGAGTRIIAGPVYDATAEEVTLNADGETATITSIWTLGTPPPATTIIADVSSPKIKVRKPPFGFGGGQVLNLGTGNVVTIGSKAIASPENTGPIEGQVVDAQDNPFGSGLLPPGATLNVSFLPAGAILFENLSTAANLTYTVYGMTFTLNPGESYTAQPAQVNVSAPSLVASSLGFTANISISGVQDLDAANYDITFNPAVLRLDDVTSGSIGGMVIPVDGWNQREPGRFTIIQNIPGLDGVSGNGTLVSLRFHVIGAPGQSSNITLSDGVLSSNQAQAIPATWWGGFVVVSAIPGDATGDGKVNAIDITKVERIIAQFDQPTPGADANQDGNINALDITKVERIIVGLE